MTISNSNGVSIRTPPYIVTRVDSYAKIVYLERMTVNAQYHVIAAIETLPEDSVDIGKELEIRT